VTLYTAFTALYGLNQALRFLAQGIDQAWDRKEYDYDYLQLLGLLANLSIDMNLPECGDWALKCHQSVTLSEPSLVHQQEYRRLDWWARLSLRQNQFAEATGYMEAKLRDRPGEYKDHIREVLWLLYIQALEHKDNAQISPKYQQWLEIALSEYERMDQIGSNGNSPAGYLLRSLACCAWSFADEALLEKVECCRPLIKENITGVDPGPWAFALCFSALMRGDQQDLSLALGFLNAKNYWLEAACFARLAGIEIQEYSEKFFRLQKEMLEIARNPEFNWANRIGESFPQVAIPDSELRERNRLAWPM
jgi:hypothetical protein